MTLKHFPLAALASVLPPMKPNPVKGILLIAVISALAIPLVSRGQTTVFQDTFANGSTLNPTSAVTPTSNKTAYEIASSKTASTTTLTGGLLTLSTNATSSGYTEAQAQFIDNADAITLSSAGQYIEVYATFNDTTNLFNGTAGQNEQLVTGLYDSGGTPLTDGANLWAGGLTSASTTEATGDAQNWLGYTGNIAYSLTADQSSAIDSRGAQTLATNEDQGLGEGSGTSLTGVGSNSSSSFPFPTLTSGQAYTVAMQIVYLSPTSDYITESLLTGAGLAGTVLYTYNVTTGSVLTDTFDSLDIGYRPTGGSATTVPISDITVVEGLTSVPEPSTYALLGLVMLGAGLFRRRLLKRA